MSVRIRSCCCSPRLLSILICFAWFSPFCPQPSASAGDDTSGEVSESLDVALTGKFPPFSFYDQEGELAGFDVDVSREVARRLNRPVNFVATEWDGILAGLLAGKYDAIIGSMAVTPERQKAVDFSDPYYYSGAQLFIHADNRDEIDGIEDCSGKKIGVGLGETYEHYLRENHPTVDVVTYKGMPDIFQDMQNGRLDGFVTDRLVGGWQIKKAKMDFVPAGDQLYRERIGIPVRKDRPKLVQQINTALAGMRADGFFDTLHRKWFGLESAAKEHAPDTEPFRVALTGKFPPFSYYNQDGELAGFDVDVARAVGGRLNRPVEIIASEWDGILAGLLAEKYDAIIGSMAITEERKKAVNFSDPYYTSGAQLFVHREARQQIRDIEDCADRKIGVNLGETYEHYLRDHHPEVEIVTYKGMSDIFQDMQNRRLDGFVTDRLVGSWQIKKAGKSFVPAGELLYQEKIGIPVRKGRPELLKRINLALRGMQADGQFERIHDRYFGLEQAKQVTTGGLKTSVIVEKLAKGFGISLGVAAASILIGFLLAIPGGVALNRHGGFLHFFVRGGVDFIRGTPVLIQLFFVYFGAPQIGITLSPITSAIVTLSINAAAYMSEVFRAGLMSVEPGQALAGRALGLSKLQVFRLIVWPQAFRIAIPPLMNSVVALIKDTALISIISVSEVVREAQSIISITFDPIRFYFIVAVMFFVVTFPLMKLAGYMERRIRERGFAND